MRFAFLERDAERARAFARESGVNDVRHGPTPNYNTPVRYIKSDVGASGRAKSRTSVPPRAASPVRTMSLQVGVSAQKIEFSGFDLMYKQMILC